MTHALVALLFFLGQPFWEAKAPEQWSDEEIDTLRNASPWAQTAGENPPVLVYLATAAPIEDAEAQLRLRTKHPLAEPDPDYADFLRLNREKVIVLAIPWGRMRLGNEAERKKMEEQSVMIVGGKTYQLVGHFPPDQFDPVLRLVFPREVKPTDKSVIFRLYLAGVTFPEREIEFRTKDILYHGKLEM